MFSLIHNNESGGVAQSLTILVVGWSTLLGAGLFTAHTETGQDAINEVHQQLAQEERPAHERVVWTPGLEDEEE